ncbi:MAG: HD domain-containing protein [Verrucomicrobiaceae bacterium]|nr:MAG: HD domain-containing protein [Verrucomicrobiaceae bacterium]
MSMNTEDAMQRQLAFLVELDRLKSIVRQSPLVDRSRKENSAEHSWHLALFALVLSEHAPGIDVTRVVKMLLLHDIVEIDAGDAPIHLTLDDRTLLEQAERQAAERIFGMLPSELGQEFLDLWLEFEAALTVDARFAKALDRLQPLLLNTLTGGGTWTENGVTEQQVMDRYGPVIEKGSPVLWQEAAKRVRQYFLSVEKSDPPG